jgi:tetratricopeptide (TPR) repeat protein
MRQEVESRKLISTSRVEEPNEVDPALAERLEKLEKFQRDFEKFVEFEPTRREMVKENIDVRFQGQDRLLVNIGAQVDRFGIIASLFGLIVAVGLASAAYFGYRNAVSETRESVAKWFEDKDRELKSELEKKLAPFDEALAVIKARKEEYLNQIEDIGQIPHGSPGGGWALNAQSEVVKKFASVSSYLMNYKKRSDFTAMDWYSLAMNSYFQGLFLESIEYIDMALAEHGMTDTFKAWLLVIKGSILSRVGRHTESVAMFQDLVDTFNSNTDVDSQQIVLLSRAEIVFNDLFMVKSKWKVLDVQAELGRILERIDAIEANTRDEYLLAGYKGYVLALSCRFDEAKSLLRKSLGEGGELMFVGQMLDSGINATQEDVRFREILSELWREMYSTAPLWLGYSYTAPSLLKK